MKKSPYAYVELTEANFPQDRDPAHHITCVQCIVEAGHRVPTGIRDLLHLAELVCATSSKVKERETIKVLGLLVRFLYDLGDHRI